LYRRYFTSLLRTSQDQGHRPIRYSVTMDAAFEKNGREKMPVVIHAITEHLQGHADSSARFPDLVEINKALEAGDKLQLELLAGGNTNFSYKVSLENSPDKAPLFAKLTMAKALWNPYTSIDFDLSRTENEFIIMNKFQNILTSSKDMSSTPVVTPYFCVDAGPGYRLLVTEWSTADEQWANQFIDGHVDERILEKLAMTFATLHCSTSRIGLDQTFNDKVMPYMMTIFPLIKALSSEYLLDSNDVNDKGVVLMHRIGQTAFHRMVDNMEERFQEGDCMVHSDATTFNILVEPKPSIEELREFGSEGSFVLCDWENAYMGPIGRDMGVFSSWAFACAFSHAVQGHGSVAYHLVGCMYSFWESYAAALVEKGGKDEEFLKATYRDSLGWNGFVLLFIFHMLRLDCENLPLEGVGEDHKAKTFSSISYVAVRCLQWGFSDLDKDLSLDELNMKFMDLVAAEIDSLVEITAKSKARKRPKRPSMLRESGKRVSDGYMHAEVANRMSQLTLSTGTTSLSFRRKAPTRGS
jgi:thiamine kinase-like enzyme